MLKSVYIKVYIFFYTFVSYKIFRATSRREKLIKNFFTSEKLCNINYAIFAYFALYIVN